MPWKSTSLTADQKVPLTATRPQSDHRCVPSSPCCRFLHPWHQGNDTAFVSLPHGKACKDTSHGADGLQGGIFHTTQARGADGGAPAFPMLAQMELSGRAPILEGPTLLSWHLWQRPLCWKLNSSSPGAETPPDLAPFCEGEGLGTDAAEQPWPPSPSCPSPALPACLQHSWIHTAINDKAVTLLHQGFIFQTHSPSAPRSMSSAAQRQGRWRCYRASSGDPIIPPKPTRPQGCTNKTIFTGKRLTGIREALSLKCAKQGLVLQPPSRSGETPGLHKDVSHSDPFPFCINKWGIQWRQQN